MAIDATVHLEVWRAEGLSMAPLLLPGDRILLAPPSTPPRLGELLLWRAEPAPVLHRLLAYDAARRICQEAGDAGLVRKERPWADVLGRVVAVAPAGEGPWVFTGPPSRLATGLARMSATHSSGRSRRAWLARLLRPYNRRRRALWIREQEIMRSNPHIQVQDLDDELLVHDPATGKVHMLNPTAALIWRDLTAGFASEAIAQRLAKRFGISEAEALTDTRATLDQFIEQGLWDVA